MNTFTKPKNPLRGIPFLTGAAIGLDSHTLPGLNFNHQAPYRACMLCGTIFQSSLDRACYDLNERIQNGLTGDVSEYRIATLKHKLSGMNDLATKMRQDWADKHSRISHSTNEHEELFASGQICTPEAALKLAPLGISPLNPNDEVASAMLEAPRAPSDDSESDINRSIRITRDI